ncbi:hypothetical protein GL263_05850 [Streptomyces durbertensis]|uniref:DUF6980 domain-containing protein n=1 Tax=Streptomyces durbertensis TaxID=2448886 RepID=A0ABR6ECP5_9ACTN|nr:hypothetical protein [Streptomyces durbertensis]MBB1243091.1 hypothetical protein [Streptomyces durbertensis]
MAGVVESRCAAHPDGCPDRAGLFEPRFAENLLPVPDGGSSGLVIDFCPWCGARPPESRRDGWFDELERLGLDPDVDAPPAEYTDDRWWRGGTSGG